MVNKVVSEIHINSNINRITHKYLPQPLKFCPGSLYLLPKIHKTDILDIEKFKGLEAW